MATLKEISDLVGVPMLTVYHVLNKSNEVDIDTQTRQSILSTAQQLNYSLKITQVDIADYAGVAKGTVSYALNNSNLIKPETRQKVLDAAQALGYRLNITARNLRTNSAGVVGYSWHIADDPTRMNNLLDRFIYRVTMVAEEHNYHLLTFIQPQIDAEQVYENLISTSRVDGFILSDVTYDDPRVTRLLSMNAPFVAFGGMNLPETPFPFVDVDGSYGIELVVEHLLNIGHERIGLLTWHPGLPFGDARERAYHQSMERAGIRVEDDWIAYTPNILDHSAAATHQVMNAKHRPTALICTNDLMAFGAKSYLDKVGLRVPEDIALTGYDDDPTAAFLEITSVRQPIDIIAKTLFEILYGEIHQTPMDERQVVFMPELIIRKSTTG